MSDDSGSATPGVKLWEDLLADTDAIAEEYREAGWEVVVVQPGDVSPVQKDERFGFSVLVPDSEYDTVEAIVEREDVTFDAAEIYHRPMGNTTFALAVELDTDSETAVLVPLAYGLQEMKPVFETALEEGELRIHVRPLSIDTWVSFAHDDPSLFVDEERLADLEANAPETRLSELLEERDEGGDEE
ncbi:DUF7529 family protein [Natrononativus amylolyticus]|uniref:DUF7529 family protein n=1 Tax=Natrononativus amylolyticus TaxID=2963434 RepID=UPI0020CC20F1|nr:hypothetical protein [Natrononativus amylolyticus]